jgi:adenylylsulfate kinase-like enzyme
VKAGVPTLLITGTVAVGKTAVAVELGALLEERGVAVALIDLDWLNWVHVGANESRDDLMVQNLAAVWPNFVAAGARAFVLVRGVERKSTLAALRGAVPDALLTVVRLVAAPDVIERRLRRRDSGKELEEHLRQSAPFAKAIEEARLEDATVASDEASVREVAERVLAVWRPFASWRPDIANPS